MSDWSLIWGMPLWFWLFILPSMSAIFARIFRRQAQFFLRPIWWFLDKVYFASGLIAAGFMVIILLIILGQMGARWSGVTFEGSTEFAGYAMAATSFFALAHALTRGAHIRVSIFLNINNFTRLWLDATAMFVAAVTATYFARYAIKTNVMSEMLNDRTQGQDQVPEAFLSILNLMSSSPDKWAHIWSKMGDGFVFTPVWLPQIPMSIGTTLLAIALWDNLIRLLVLNKTAITSEVLR